LETGKDQHADHLGYVLKRGNYAISDTSRSWDIGAVK
jgi:hypothetical protein